MSRTPSLLDKLDALEAMADSKIPAPPPPEPPRPAAPPVAAAGPGSQADIYALLSELKRDIVNLQREQTQQRPPELAKGPQSAQEQYLYGLLNELKRDVESLRREQAAQSLPPMSLPPGERQLYAMLNELRADIRALEDSRTSDSRRDRSMDHLPPAERQLYAMLNELRADIRALEDHRASDSRDRSMDHLPPAERQLYAMLNELRADIRALEDSREGDGRSRLPVRWSGPPPQAAGTSRYGSIPAIWLLALLPLAMLGGYFATTLDLGSSRLVAGNASSSSAAARASAAATGETPLFEALAAGTASPRGVSAAGVGDARALSRAASLLSDPARDTEEAAFWLKRYLSAAMSDRQVARALTQLGSAQADPTGKAPDYTKARHLWEMASAAGDPVAMCFLGKLFEGGTGVAGNKRTALNWYERAKRSGGCSDVDDSIARLRQ